MLIHNKDDIEFVTEFPCFLGHPVCSLKSNYSHEPARQIVILLGEFKIFRIIFVFSVINFILCFKKEILTVPKVLLTYK